MHLPSPPDDKHNVSKVKGAKRKKEKKRTARSNLGAPYKKNKANAGNHRDSYCRRPTCDTESQKRVRDCKFVRKQVTHMKRLQRFKLMEKMQDKKRRASVIRPCQTESVISWDQELWNGGT